MELELLQRGLRDRQQHHQLLSPVPSSPAPFTINFGNTPLPSYSIGPPPPYNARSSPIHLETDSTELLKEFFEEISTHRQLAKHAAKLLDIQEKLITQDFDLDGIKHITEQRWESWDFTAGLLLQIQRQISPFKNRRKARQQLQ